MHEFISEERPYYDFPHDTINLANEICIKDGLRPKISEDVPKLLADLIIKCWDGKVENRPTASQNQLILVNF
ncbi:hypothetical protein C1645_758784 [Glomus cerebriforme]|uniref:Serine-threonine/tyrosine-protein kinase catalytic domain-containing protein n=1 Tax=Glomus cerebriforme TaxID=658196 RepID=A0A397T9N0_9GLOM|nr:hypothetical protein C1645_758784 [Glomus cerebriforme]